MRTLIIILFSIITFEVNSQDWIWAKQNYGTNINGDDHGLGIATDKNGYSYITGYFQDTITLGSLILITPTPDETDMFIAKLSPSGNFIWARQAGGKQMDQGYDIVIDQNSNCYITGYFQDTAYFDSDTLFAPYNTNAFICKYDSSGNLKWVKQTGNFDNASNYGSGIAKDFEDNIYITGRFSDSIAFDSYSFNGGGIFVAKFDSSGNCIWAKQEGKDNNDFPPIEAYKVSCDATGNSYIVGCFAGTFQTSLGTMNALGAGDIFILKYDSSGQLQWNKRMGGANTSWTDEGTDIEAENDGDFFLTGTFHDNADFDTINFQSTGVSDIFISKWNTNGNIIWAKKAGGYSTDYGYSVNLSNNHKLYSTGAFTDVAYFGQDSIISNCYMDLFVAEYDTNGTIIHLYQSHGNNIAVDNAWGMCISSDNYNNVYTTGLFQGSTLIGSTTLTSSGFCDILFTKIGPKPEFINQVDFDNGFFVYPNPCNEFLIVNIAISEIDNFSLHIYDSFGRLIKQNIEFQNNVSSIDMSEINAGIYFLLISINGKMTSRKIIKIE